MKEAKEKKFSKTALSLIRDDEIIINSLSKLIIPILITFASYIQFNGEHSPGGGFQAGILFAMVLIVYSLVFGINKAKKFINSKKVGFLSILGVLIYFFTGLACVMFGGNMFEYSVFYANKPILGNKIGIFIIELGVCVSVFGSVLIIYYSIFHFIKAHLKYKKTFENN